MASKLGLSYRQEDAERRGSATLAAIANALEVTFPVRTVKRRDAASEAVERIEAWADDLEVIAGALAIEGYQQPAAPAAEDEAETAGDPETEADPEGPNLVRMTRPQLNAYLTEQFGFEDPAALPNKDAVIALIRELAAGPPPPPVSADDPDEPADTGGSTDQ